MKALFLLLAVALMSPAMGQFIGTPVDDVTRIANPGNRAIEPPKPDAGVVVHMAPSGAVMSRTPRTAERVGTDERPLSPMPVDLPDGLGEQFANYCFEGLRKSFYDPYSARMDDWHTLRMPDGGVAVVVKLNGKNRFGGYVGAKPYHCWRTATKEIKVGEGTP